MKQLYRLTALCLVLVFAVPAMADKAGSLYNKGRDAEARRDYETAYAFYKQAFDLKPKDLKYRTSMERMKFMGAASHVHRGQILREQGKLQEALVEFQKAVEIDPSSFIAQQELRRTQEEIKRGEAGPPPQAAVSPLGKRIAQAGGPVELAPVSDVPITLRLTEDTKVVYETIGKLAGINVLFDPDYTSRRIHIELNGVSLIDALELVAMNSKTFWRPVTPNTIFVAADTPAKRRELEQNIIKTFYLANLSAPTELQDVVNTLRTILEVSRITQMPSQGAIIVRGTPDQVALAEKLIGDLDKARPEVIVEVAVMQVSRDKLRQLGIQPPTSASIALQPNVTTNNTNGTTTGTANQINLNRLGNLTAKDFVVTIPPASVSFLATDSTTKLIQNPQIRALDGQKASLKIGDRVPVATGSFGAGIGGVGLNSLVNTQFQYIDVGVNIDITPKVHQNRDISLKIMLDISAVTGQSNIGGVNQPIIGQRKIEHEIRLKEGEVNLLGGILEDTQTKALNGFPWISQVPILKYLFSSETAQHKENEIVFALVPHVVRAQELSTLNLRPLDIGTGTVIDLRMSSRPAEGTTPSQAPGTRPAPATPAPGTPVPPAQPQQPPSAQPPAPSGPAVLSFDPVQGTQAPGSTFSVNVQMAGGQNIYSVPVQIGYDPKLLQLVNVSNGNFLSRDGQAVALVHRDDGSTGTLQVTATRPPNSGGVNGDGTVFTLTFMAKAPGKAVLNITRAGIKDAMMNSIPVSGSQATINISQ
ncbi:MAG TPA: cohesin domain-containing protein [Terriglobales bacterium]|nr:cohesin domain-containing protein [Terriglobales bacterium]